MFRRNKETCTKELTWPCKNNVKKFSKDKIVDKLYVLNEKSIDSNNYVVIHIINKFINDGVTDRCK